MQLVQSFEDESISALKDFEELNKLRIDEKDADDSESDGSNESDKSQDIHVDLTETTKNEDAEFSTPKTTIFINKYFENPNLPSIACRLADAIVEYETAQGIPIVEKDDDELDDEVLSEEEYLNSDTHADDLCSLGVDMKILFKEKNQQQKV